MVFDLIAKAAQNDHGIELQPSQVQEVFNTFLQVQKVGLEQAARLRMAVQVIETLIRENDGTIELQQENIAASEEGFWMRNVDGLVRFGLGTPPEETVVEAEIVDEA